MQDNLKENGNLTDDQMSDVAGGKYYYNQPTGDATGHVVVTCNSCPKGCYKYESIDYSHIEKGEPGYCGMCKWFYADVKKGVCYCAQS